VDDNLPRVTVLIAARPGQTDIKAAEAGHALDYPAEKLEIIIARGRQPSVQRNAGMREARGEWIYFLDDDSVCPAATLRLAARYFSDPAVKMVGGPNLCPPEAPEIEQVFALVLSSWLAFGPSRARYTRVGQARSTSEKELILCNLLARRDALLELGGFNEALYPNEENALMDELQKRGGKLIYDPEIVVYRRPRGSLSSFCRMLMTYGRGRAEQFRLHPTSRSALNFVPPLFCAYVLALLVTLLAAPAVGLMLGALFALYLAAVVGQAVALFGMQRPSKVASWGTRAARALAAMPLIVLTHVLYGAGFWHGLLTRLKKDGERTAAEVAVERLGSRVNPNS